MTPAETSFLRAILAGDPAAALLYSDWLEDAGREDDAALWALGPWPRTEAWRILLRPISDMSRYVHLVTHSGYAFDHVYFPRLPRYAMKQRGVRVQVFRRLHSRSYRIKVAGSLWVAVRHDANDYLDAVTV